MGKMINILEKIGPNAGKIWETLDVRGSLQQANLIEITRLNEGEFYAAVGWLARENKICKERMMYKLGKTNLTNRVGGNAGKVWKVLQTWGEVDASHVPRLAGLNIKDTYYAFGWLAREGKIKSKKEKPLEHQIKIELK
jgi:hypothetical protein